MKVHSSARALMLLACVNLICFAQTGARRNSSQAKAKPAEQKEFSTTTTTTSGSSGMVWTTTGSFSSAPLTITTGGSGTISGWGGLAYTDSYGQVFYAQSGLEMRPLDNKGPTLAQVDSSAVPVDQVKLAPAAYLKLAREVKLEDPSSDEAEMLQTIWANHFRVYSFDKVDNYLYRQALKMGTHVHWVWKPMREHDLEALHAIGLVPPDNGIVDAKLYAQRVPARVLEDAKCVLGDIKDAVFLISDFEVLKPDPFLAISTPRLLAQGKLWIVDRWDEPGFDDGKVREEVKGNYIHDSLRLLFKNLFEICVRYLTTVRESSTIEV